MELKLKQLENLKVDEKNWSAMQDYNLGQLEIAKRFQSDYDTLSQEEFLRYVSLIYDFSITEEDFKKIAETILGSGEVKKGKIKTTLLRQYNRQGIGPIWNEWYDTWGLDAEVFYAHASGIDFKHFYTEEELRELIQRRRVILVKFVGRNLIEELTDYQKDAENYKSFVIADNISLTNLGVYGDIIALEIKKMLSKERMAEDICTLIDEARSGFNSYLAMFGEAKKEAEKKLAFYQGACDECVSSLTELEQDKKAILARINRSESDN